MSGKTSRQIRKGLNEIERKLYIRKKEIAEQCVRELIASPFKYRFLFAVKILFRRKR